jgi:hypothetical protein
MSDKSQSTEAVQARRIPIDVWAVLLALTLAALVKLGWFPGIAW